MRSLHVFFCCIVICSTVPAISAESSEVNVEKRFETKKPLLVKADKSSDDSVPIFRDAAKKPRIVSKAKVRTVATEKKFRVGKNEGADRFNPQIIGANKLSMQKFNKYAYRKNNSSQPGVPVKKAAGDDPLKKTK